MDEQMSAGGWRRGKDWVTHTYPGAEHNEVAWAKRVYIPLRFILGLDDAVTE
jgi:hypothetical protein